MRQQIGSQLNFLPLHLERVDLPFLPSLTTPILLRLNSSNRGPRRSRARAICPPPFQTRSAPLKAAKPPTAPSLAAETFNPGPIPRGDEPMSARDHLAELAAMSPEERPGACPQERMRMTARRALFGTKRRDLTPARRTIPITDQRK
jgi:hypothetical protein